MGYLEESPLVTNEAEADALLAKIEAPTGSFDATKVVNEEKTAAPGTEITGDKPVVPAVDPVAPVMEKMIWKGKEIQVPQDKYKAYAQKGYDYEEKMRSINQERAQWLAEKTQYDTKYKGVEAKLQEYKAVEDYAKKDPAWWDHVRQSFNTKQKELGSIAQDPVVQKLSEELSGIKEFVSSQKEREKQAMMIKEDTELDQEIKEFRDQHPEFDWNTLDEHGKDLEWRIGNHSLQSGIKSFRAAARDLLFDEMLKRNEVKAKEDLGKKIQKVSKLGLGEVRLESKAKVTKSTNVRSKSYDELAAEAVRELQG